MTETTARQFIISFIIFSAIITGVFTLIAGSLNDDSSTRYAKYNTSLNRFDDLVGTTNEIEGVVNAEGKQAEDNILNSLVKRTLGVFPLIWNSYATFTSVISDLSEGAIGIPIPGWFTSFIISVVVIVIAFALMSAWFQWRI